MAGVHFSKFDAVLSSETTGQRESASKESPLPVIGVHGSVAIGRQAELGARIRLFRLHFDRYEGSLNYATLELQRRFGEKFSVGVAYNYYALNLDSAANSLSGTLEVRHRGPALFASVGF